MLNRLSVILPAKNEGPTQVALLLRLRADKLREFLRRLPSGFSYPAARTMLFSRSDRPVANLAIRTAQRAGKSHIKPLRDGLRYLLSIFKIAVPIHGISNAQSRIAILGKSCGTRSQANEYPDFYSHIQSRGET